MLGRAAAANQRHLGPGTPPTDKDEASEDEGDVLPEDNLLTDDEEKESLAVKKLI